MIDRLLRLLFNQLLLSRFYITLQLQVDRKFMRQPIWSLHFEINASYWQQICDRLAITNEPILLSIVDYALESCHHMSCDTDTDSTATNNTIAKFKSS